MPLRHTIMLQKFYLSNVPAHLSVTLVHHVETAEHIKLVLE